MDAAEIKPFRIQYYCEKRDPDFEAKMHEVLLVYKQIEMLFDENGELFIPAGEHDVHTYSYDEKQAFKPLPLQGRISIQLQTVEQLSVIMNINDLVRFLC